MCVHDMPTLTAIVGRRRFDRINGNTYHTAELILSDGTSRRSPMSYGYDDQYIQTGVEFAATLGLLPPFDLDDLDDFCSGCEVEGKHAKGKGIIVYFDKKHAALRVDPTDDKKDLLVPITEVLVRIPQNGCCMQYTWQWRKRHGINTSVTDGRKKDL